MSETVTPKQVKRKVKIAHGPQTHRPGLPVPAATQRLLLIRFCIPTSTTKGTAEERDEVDRLRQQLTEFVDVGEVGAVRVERGEYQLDLVLHGLSMLNDDQLLTCAFIRLKSLIDSSQVLQEGFCEDKPYWQAIKFGDFVADEGPFTRVDAVPSAPSKQN